MKEIHLTKKDFKIDWYSGQGAGGQHRNKHQNCCRITHIESGITCNGTASRNRADNQREAFQELSRRVIIWYIKQEPGDIRISNDLIRTYHEPRNEVIDHASGVRDTYTTVVEKGKIDEMVTARKEAFDELHPSKTGLSQQIDSARKSMEDWPEWLKREAHF